MRPVERHHDAGRITKHLSSSRSVLNPMSNPTSKSFTAVGPRKENGYNSRVATIDSYAIPHSLTSHTHSRNCSSQGSSCSSSGGNWRPTSSCAASASIISTKLLSTILDRSLMGFMAYFGFLGLFVGSPVAIGQSLDQSRPQLPCHYATSNGGHGFAGRAPHGRVPHDGIYRSGHLHWAVQRSTWRFPPRATFMIRPVYIK